MEQELNPIASKHDTTRELHKTATKGLSGLLLHETLLTKNFEGDQQFFRDGGHMESHSTTPRPQKPGDPLGSSHVVPHEDAPAFSDIATTVMTTVSPTSPGKLVSVGQNGSSKRRFEGKLEDLGGKEVMATSPSRIGQQRASPRAQQPSRVGSTKKEVRKWIVGNPTEMDGDTTITSIIHTTTVISTMREQGTC